MNEVYISERIWKSCVEGFLIADCAIRSKTTIALCLRKNIPHEDVSWTPDSEIETRLFLAHLDGDGQSDDSYGCRYLTGYNLPKLGVSTLPLAQALLAARNTNGQVSVMGGGGKFADEFIDHGKVPMPWRIKTIGGYAYSVGGQRKIYKRIAVGQWDRVLELPPVDAIETVGFKDMDAFNDNDIYAVGGHGDVWHFNGERWRQMGFSSNVQLGTVTCAGDGQVYISGEGGSLWVGKQSSWKRVYEGSSSILWNDVLWFDGKLWLSSDYQFRIWDGKSLEPVTHDGKQLWFNGHMDVRDGLLAIAGIEQVNVFDGKTWRTIVAPYL
jgi:hypothetical protein